MVSTYDLWTDGLKLYKLSYKGTQNSERECVYLKIYYNQLYNVYQDFPKCQIYINFVLPNHKIKVYRL